MIVAGERAVYQRAITYRAHHESWEGRLVFIDDVLPGGDAWPYRRVEPDKSMTEPQLDFR